MVSWPIKFVELYFWLSGKKKLFKFSSLQYSYTHLSPILCISKRPSKLECCLVPGSFFRAFFLKICIYWRDSVGIIQCCPAVLSSIDFLETWSHIRNVSSQILRHMISHVGSLWAMNFDDPAWQLKFLLAIHHQFSWNHHSIQLLEHLPTKVREVSLDISAHVIHQWSSLSEVREVPSCPGASGCCRMTYL